MKPRIRTTFFAAFIIAVAIQSGSLSTYCMEAYTDCIVYMASSTYVPQGFLN